MDSAGATATPTPAGLETPSATQGIPTEAAPTPSASAIQSPTPASDPDPTGPAVGPTQIPPTTSATPGLTLEVFAPDDGATVPGTIVVVYGVTEPGAKVKAANVETVGDPQGGFRMVVPLEDDTNVLEIIATDDEGNRVSEVRRVTALALPFLLLITEPESESVVYTPTLTLSGRTGPNAVVSINGRSLPVDQFGYFSASVLLEEGPNFIDVVATNDDGRTLSEVVAVIFRPPSQ